MIRTPSLIHHNVPLIEKNWFRTGGPARFYAAPQTAAEFVDVVRWAQINTIPITVLGSGANVLISDAGINGLVIRPHLAAIMHSKDSDTNNVSVTAGAGAHIADLINYCLDHNILGLEEFSGIPGTVGGSVYINLHYFEFLLEQFLVHATLIDKQTAEIIHVDRSWFGFRYNHSLLHAKNHYLVDATFSLRLGNSLETMYARGRHDEIIRHRLRRYPRANTCGSFFRNFFDHEINHLTTSKKKIMYVAYYLDTLGIKGAWSVGGACVSHQHANMIVNVNNATSADIIGLAKKIQDAVYQTFGLMPQPECQLLGFREYPLARGLYENVIP
jgi:UDP-N-acetylmuramate dehydrogenase